MFYSAFLVVFSEQTVQNIRSTVLVEIYMIIRRFKNVFHLVHFSNNSELWLGGSFDTSCLVVQTLFWLVSSPGTGWDFVKIPVLLEENASWIVEHRVWWKPMNSRLLTVSFRPPVWLIVFFLLEQTCCWVQGRAGSALSQSFDVYYCCWEVDSHPVFLWMWSVLSLWAALRPFLCLLCFAVLLQTRCGFPVFFFLLDLWCAPSTCGLVSFYQFLKCLLITTQTLPFLPSLLLRLRSPCGTMLEPLRLHSLCSHFLLPFRLFAPRESVIRINLSEHQLFSPADTGMCNAFAEFLLKFCVPSPVRKSARPSTMALTVFWFFCLLFLFYFT